MAEKTFLKAANGERKFQRFLHFCQGCEVIGTPGHRDNLIHVYASFKYNQLFIKNISQLREEKCHRSQRQ